MDTDRLIGTIGGNESEHLSVIDDYLANPDFAKNLKKLQFVGLLPEVSLKLERAVAEILMVLGHYAGTAQIPRQNAVRLKRAFADFNAVTSSLTPLNQYIWTESNKTWR